MYFCGIKNDNGVSMELQFPPFLSEGDCVTIVSPSGKIAPALIDGAVKRLESWGLRVRCGKYAASSHGRYAGTVGQRLRDLQRAMDDPRTKAILCSRGGYGAVHLLENIDFTAFREHPKWLIGFSDITVLHCLFQQQGYASLHAPMARHLTEEPDEDEAARYLRELLFGMLPRYACEGNRLNRKGKARGILRGGNFAVAYGLRATPYDIPAEDTILFLEDVGERPHAVERMLYNLRLSGVLDRLSGLIVGRFTEYEEDCSLGKELYAAMADVLKGYDFPVCFGFPVGHVTRNMPLICGASVELEVSRTGVTLDFNVNKA